MLRYLVVLFVSRGGKGVKTTLWALEDFLIFIGEDWFLFLKSRCVAMSGVHALMAKSPGLPFEEKGWCEEGKKEKDSRS